MKTLQKSFALSVLVLTALAANADEFERVPISYSTATPVNAISRLQARLDKGDAAIAYDKEFGYLPSVLQALNVPISSQTLVFSKTSLQRSRISPKTPRALYFSDDMYIGYCQSGQVLEISAVDPMLGTVFYSLDQQPTAKPKFERQVDACILCHGSSQTRGVPGHIVRSVYPDLTGEAVFALGSQRVDQTTPIDRRWGGWYVTGTHGKQLHRGNLIVANRNDRETIANNPLGRNITNLKNFFDTSAYLTPHSDIVALMVLEHQVEMHNLITRLNFQTRLALHDQRQLNKELGRAPNYWSETTYRRIKAVAEPMLRYMFFSGEAKLTEKLQGTSSFAAEFAKIGRRDGKGRGFREFDLQTRLFKYPCSYLIHSEPFERLPTEAKDYVYQRIHEILINRDYTRDFDHLTDADRHAIWEILRATKRDLPSYFAKK